VNVKRLVKRIGFVACAGAFAAATAVTADPVLDAAAAVTATSAIALATL